VNHLVRAELLKQRTTPVFQMAFAATPVLAALVTFAVLGAAGRQGNDPLGPDSFMQALSAPASVVTTLALLLGVVGLSGEYRHKTITTTLLTTPRRRDVVVAKLLAHGLTGAAMALVTSAVVVAVAVPWLRSAGVPLRVDADVAQALGALLGSTVLHAMLGIAVAALVRNQAAALSAVFVWLLAVEKVVAWLLASFEVAGWLPAALGRALAGTGGSVSPWAAAAGLAAYVVGFAALGTRFVVNRDVT
jgi:ABC-2 type transport system permease protein